MSILTSEEMQKTFEGTILSLQKNMDDERKKYKDKIDKLEENVKLKEEEINELRNKLLSTKKIKKEDKELIENLKTEKELIQNEMEKKITDYKSALINVSTLKNQLQMEKDNIMNLQYKYKLELEECEKKHDEKYKTLEQQFFLIEKKIDEKEEKIKEIENILKEKDKDINNKNIEIEKLNNHIKELEENKNSILNYVKEIEEKEILIKKEREEIKAEKEKYNKLNNELMNKNKKIETKKINEIEKIINKEEEKNEEIKDIKNTILEGQEKIISDLLCEFLLKLNILQYYISLFDLLDKTLKQYDELKIIENLNFSKHESMNDILYNFYESLKSYFIINQGNSNFNDFLLQKNFRLTEMGKEDIEIIKKVNSIRLGKDINILELYRKKRELFFKSKEFTFNIIKEKILGENIININEIQNEFLKITKPPLELEVNFNEIIKINYNLTKYQVHNIFSKLKELTIHITDIQIFLIYSLVVNCFNLNTLKIIFIKEQSEQQNNICIQKLNDIFPILLNYLKKLNSFSIINLPLSSNKLPQLVEALKISKIKKLTLSNCFTKKEDISLLMSYFSQNTLLEIDLSNHYFHIPSLLNNSLLNYSINKQLTSISFNNCKLNEDDIKYISNYIVSSSSILICDIGKNILSPLSCSTFGYCILKTTSLETLRINECGINGESLLFIFNGKGSKPLKHVNLNGNEFGDIGLVSISAFMKNSPLLESIELEKCGGTDMGFVSLANMIQSNANSKIKYVNFHKNNVSIASLGILKKFNNFFTSKKLVFALDKIEGQFDNNDINCAIFT